jgi:hypothetical protein
MSVVRYLVIVGRTQPDLCEYLTRQFAGDAKVDVLPDRRWTERRRRAQASDSERRQGQRRQGATQPLRFQTVAVIRRSPEAVVSTPPPPFAARAGNGDAERTSMEETAPAPTVARRQLIRWLDESRHLFGLLPGVLDELRAVQQECERLGQRVDEYRAENERLRAERAELAEALTGLIHQMTRPVNEIVQKLRVTQQRDRA